MSILDEAEVPKDRPPVITILGDGGVGKTSLAALFPKPFFIRLEDGLAAIPKDRRPKSLPIVETVDDLWEQVRALIKDDHGYETVVIDSVSKLDELFTRHVIESDPKNPSSIITACGGYTGGLKAVGALHQRLRKGCGYMNERRGMNVVFISHADTETVPSPDQESYSRYTLKMGKFSSSPYINDVDIVGFVRLKSFTRGDKGDKVKKIISDGSRVIDCASTASSVSKNRYGITEPLPLVMGVNPFVGIVPSLTTGE